MYNKYVHKAVILCTFIIFFPLMCALCQYTVIAYNAHNYLE